MSQNKALIEQHYKENFDVLVKKVSYRTGNKQDAEDVVQNAFEKALRYQESFDPGKQEVGAWINTIVVRCAYDMRVSNKLQGMTVEVNEKNGGLVADNSLVDIESKQLIGEIQQTKGNKRDILYRKYMMNLSNKDIAEVLGLSVDGVKQCVKRFKQSMRDKYGYNVT